jgi:hypothetical protein
MLKVGHGIDRGQACLAQPETSIFFLQLNNGNITRAAEEIKSLIK